LSSDFLHRHRLDGPRLTVTSVVDEYADGPIPPFDLIDGRAHRVLVGHVEGQEFATTLFEGSHLLDTAGCGVDSSAHVYEALGGGPPDA
jgi:hypothetical protein